MSMARVAVRSASAMRSSPASFSLSSASVAPHRSCQCRPMRKYPAAATELQIRPRVTQWFTCRSLTKSPMAPTCWSLRLNRQVPDPREAEDGAPDQVVETQGGGWEQGDPRSNARGRRERWPRHHQTQSDWSHDERPTDRPIAPDVNLVIEPEQQRTDGDGDGRQDPVRIARGNHRNRHRERGHQLNDRCDGDPSLDVLPLGADGPRRLSSGHPDAIDGDGDHDGGEDDGQGRADLAMDGEASPNEPEGGKGHLDETADAPHPARPGGGRRGFGVGGDLGSGHDVLLWFRYQATVSAMASSSGVASLSKAD